MGCSSSSTADPKSGKPQNQTSTREQENRVKPTISRVNDRDVPNSHRTQAKQPVQNSTVNDRGVPNSNITQTKQPVKKSTIDRENKVKTQKHRDLKLNFEDFQQIDEHARNVSSINYKILQIYRSLYSWECKDNNSCVRD